jgi:hypothetical protein
VAVLGKESEQFTQQYHAGDGECYGVGCIFGLFAIKKIKKNGQLGPRAPTLAAKANLVRRSERKRKREVLNVVFAGSSQCVMGRRPLRF